MLWGGRMMRTQQNRRGALVPPLAPRAKVMEDIPLSPGHTKEPPPPAAPSPFWLCSIRPRALASLATRSRFADLAPTDCAASPGGLRSLGKPGRVYCPAHG